MLPMVYMVLVDDENVPEFEKLYRDYKDKAFKTAYDILKNYSLAEECVSDVYLAAARNLQTINKLEPYEKLRYIVISSRNRAIDIAAKENKVASDVDETECTDEKALSDISLVLWKELLSRLKPTDRDILFLMFIKGYDYKDISEMLGISQDAARMRFHSAKAKLLKYLKEG